MMALGMAPVSVSTPLLGKPDGCLDPLQTVQSRCGSLLDGDEHGSMVESGGPLSAVVIWMRPRALLAVGTNLKAADGGSGADTGRFDYRIDEFGFQVDEEDGPEQNSNKLLSTPFLENPKHRLQWIAHLEFSHTSTSALLSWEHLPAKLPRTNQLEEMVRHGIPHSLRPHLWMRLSGALHKRRCADVTYEEAVRCAGSGSSLSARQIEKDLLRTLPSNVCFSSADSPGVPRLRRLLRALSWLYPDIGYCQGMGPIAATLLLFLDEENAFWLMATLVEDILPASYYSTTLAGTHADQRVLSCVVASRLPRLHALLQRHDIELSLVAVGWFLTLLSSVLHVRLLLRVWDLLFCHGGCVVFQVALGLLSLNADHLCQLDNSADIFSALSAIPGQLDDVEQLLQASMNGDWCLTEEVIDDLRKQHLTGSLSDRGSLTASTRLGSVSLPKQRLTRRHLRRSKSLVSVILFGDESAFEDLKTKNIRQTELMVDLREAIQRLGSHFASVDPELGQTVDLTPDYSMESHMLDHQTYISVSDGRRRRAKALIDFERHDDDELGFRRNDVITVLSMRDEHCWVGELNGLTGWFPAKFAELLDERSKQYSCAGDDSVNEAVTHLVRGSLCSAFKQVMEHGMRRPPLLGGACHPWLFIEEVARREVERDYNSVYSRLVLCKTYRLDRDGKVLSPEELLYRCVEAVNMSHDAAHAQMDVKLRSLLCLGLNEQALHLWLEVLCSSQSCVNKWYHCWSFVNSPGWVQVKCELRVLARFSFRLAVDWELPVKKPGPQLLREGVQDMLVKHHLFSWDL